MEYWKEIFKDMIQEDYYEVKLINGEEYGLIIKFQSKYNAFSVKFGEVKAVRMIDEGIVQTDIICPAGRDEGTIGYLWIRRL